MIRFLLLLSVAVLIFSCDDKKTSINKFSDKDIVRIYDFKDRRLSDSLYQYLTHENPEYRREAALSFGSVQDSVAVDKIAPLLSDKDRSVQKAAAFALGQTKSLQSAKILEEYLSKETDAEVFNEIAEAYGKVAKKWKNFSANYVNDSIRAYGVAWSMYRGGVNNSIDTSDYKTSIQLLENQRELTRLGVAHFFSRGAKPFKSISSSVIQVAKEENSEDVQMAAVLSLRKIADDSTFSTVYNILKNENDYRVRVNAVRVLQAFPFERSKETLFRALRDKNLNVRIITSEVIRATAQEKFWIEIANAAAAATDWRVQANLYQAILSVKSSKELLDEVKAIYKQSMNPYQKAALLTALQSSVDAWNFISDELLRDDTPVIKYTAAGALVSINRKKDFNPTLKKEFLNIYTQAIQTGDPAIISAIADALGDSTLGYRSIVTDFSFLKQAREKLSMPKDFEAVVPLEQAIAHFERRKNTFNAKNEFNHPIDWEFVKRIPKEQTAIIKTSKGNITIKLFVEEAPGSVANFIDLVQKNYFDHKFFHRVVPNFVDQGGCKRGDGTGSEDYSIRSEFSQRKYKTGSVGMASSGKDTEGTQWFITHSPTPHLDGGYTIFAEVETGMEAVHLMEVGDQIIDVELPGFTPDKKD